MKSEKPLDNPTRYLRGAQDDSLGRRVSGEGRDDFYIVRAYGGNLDETELVLPLEPPALPVVVDSPVVVLGRVTFLGATPGAETGSYVVVVCEGACCYLVRSG